MPILTQPFSVLTPAEALEADARCQSCIQGSTTLAYACLLIRRGNFALARHVLDALERKPAVRDIAPYFRAWIGMESGDFAAAKEELLAVLVRQPADLLALSLLQACMVLEMRRHPAAIEALGSGSGEAGKAEIAESAGHAPDPDLLPFQGVVADAQTQAFGLWAPSQGLRMAGSDEYRPLLETVREELPQSLAGSVANLDGGEIQKICLAFEGRTVASWHASGASAALVAGPLQQALLTLVRAENAFSKQAEKVVAGGSA